MGFFAADTGAPPLFKHQEQTVDFLLSTDIAFDTSDPGTGKTRSAIEAFRRRRQRDGLRQWLVLAPKSILQPAWGEDLRKFAPELSVQIAYARNRQAAFDSDADVIITNHDAIKWLADRPHLWERFDQVNVDESTCYKHRTSQRSKAAAKVLRAIPIRQLMTGTPSPNTVLDLWHQIFLLDRGERLGRKFFAFRNAVCEPVQTGPGPEMVQWVDKAGASEAVSGMISDITIRHIFEECIDIPENREYTVDFELSPKHRALYNDMAEHALLELEDGEISAVHAGSLANKLLQVASGAVYDGDRVTKTLTTERYDLIMELIQQRDQTVTGFIWRHQREALTKLADKAKIPYGVIDGSASDAERERVVAEFQAGRLRTVFAHPQSAGHGLTLTKGTATIWASPTYNAEHWEQFRRRIYRAGQTKKTETIKVTARDTLEERVYDRLSTKLLRQGGLLDVLSVAQPKAA